MKLYCLSGLGVDHRAFQNIQLNGIELIHIPWIESVKNESLSDYANRLFDSADLPEEYNLVGVSFGGMVATEFAKIRQPKKLFLISTIYKKSELPFYLKVAGIFKMQKWVPILFLKSGNSFTYFLFGAKTIENKKLLKQMLIETDAKFLRWSLNAILSWKNNVQPSGVNIHGSRDRILPLKRKVEYLIQNGGHFMIVDRGKEISNILSKLAL